MQRTIIKFSYEQVDDSARLLYALRDRVQVYTFSGTLGAGKTTVIKALLQQFGVTEATASPTFAYVHSYYSSNNEALHHFDLYRIETLNDFLQAGFDEYLYQNNSWCFIEWPHVIAPLLVRNLCMVDLEYVDEETRQATIVVINDERKDCPAV